MQIAKIELPGGEQQIGILANDTVQPLRFNDSFKRLSDLLHAEDPIALARASINGGVVPIPAAKARLLAPIDQQEVWAAGVTYKRSQVARMEESETGATHYDRVYTAPRPELFFKATPRRVVGPGKPVRIRSDTKWSVPEPELTLVISPAGKLVGFTIGNDMSARDIEGENPLYLPQAKMYNQSCSIGPCILIPEKPLDRAGTKIHMTIRRGKNDVFSGETNADQLKRSFEELIEWLYKDNSFPDGAMLLTGTGIVPPNDFTLQAGDVVTIEIYGIGKLVNSVVQGP
jgi:2-dehydro-3-deoxy-D-arabinonate dehydratase